MNELPYDKSSIDPYVKKQNAKLTQVIQNFFSKAVQVILQSRSLADATKEQADNMSSGANKINKWFNLHMYSNDLPKEDLKLWKSCNDLSQIPPMIIETYLDLRQLTTRQIVVLNDDNGNPWTVTKGGSKKHEVVLERWLIEFDPSDVSGSIIDELPLIYKQAIILFRSLYGFSKLMPAYKLKKNLNKSKSSKLNLGNKVLDGKQPISSKSRIGLSKSIIPHQMLTIESHIIQKHFRPIQTTLGTLKVSIAYRHHYDFCIHDNEEVLSTHFISMDSDKHTVTEEIITKHHEESDHKPDSNIKSTNETYKRFSLSSNASMSLSPCSSNHQILRENSPSSKRPPTTTSPNAAPQRPSIQPFKIGSIGNSPPPPSYTPTNTYGGSTSLERRISITSNKSTSNASLAALLRNPRSSTSSTNTSANIPIVNSSSVNTTTQYISSFPKSISSSHGSNLQHEDNFFSNSESVTNTPRFSSSFGSRASRRFSNTSVKQNTPSSNFNDTSLLATSAGSASSGAPLSGLYIDDDISDFVRMIDSKSDLRFSTYNSNNDSKLSYNQGSNSQLDVLNKFQSLKSQHQQLGESVSASLLLHHNQISDSRQSSRKSSHSIYSPSPSLPSGSYDNPHLPSINSRLREKASDSDGEESVKSSSQKEHASLSSKKNSFVHSDGNTNNRNNDNNNEDSNNINNKGTSNNSNDNDGSTPFLKSPSTSKLVATPITSATTALLTLHKTSNPGDPDTGIISGLSTTPSAYPNKRSSIHYENVFEDDDGEDYYLSNKDIKESNNFRNEPSNSRGNRSLGNTDNLDDDDDDDLLFTMSDMNLTKH